MVTTLGSAGARYRGPAGDQIAAAPPAGPPIDTTGAGDAFTGAFAVAWLAGHDPAGALRWACAAGALATTRPGAVGARPGRNRPDRRNDGARIGRLTRRRPVRWQASNPAAVCDVSR